ncbi:MAG: hypothetical protein C5B59_07410 [Bacteroidetes bacterium]|nr:MAG: hypothetical protein C5B59_07410 [Bacteroidota bacterium]
MQSQLVTNSVATITLIIIGSSYVWLIVLCRSWVMKKNNYQTLFWVAIGLSILGNIFGFLIFKRGTEFGALNGPLLSLMTYKFLYDWFIRKYDKVPASPFDTYMSNDRTLMKDGVLNAVFVLVSIFFVAVGGLLTHGIS